MDACNDSICVANLSSARKALPRGEIRRPRQLPRMLEKALLAVMAPGAFELLANNPSGRHPRPAGRLLEPVEELLRKTNCDCVTHMNKS